MRSYGQPNNLSHSQVHIIKFTNPESIDLLCFQDLELVIGRVPKWLQEAIFNTPYNAKLRLRQRICQFHWTCGITLQVGILPPLMSHGWKYHFWLRSENRVFLSETHCNFFNGGSKVLKWTTRAYEKFDHLSHSQVHLFKVTNLECTNPLWFQDPEPIIGRTPKWLQEVRFNQPQNAR